MGRKKSDAETSADARLYAASEAASGSGETLSTPRDNVDAASGSHLVSKQAQTTEPDESPGTEDAAAGTAPPASIETQPTPDEVTYAAIHRAAPAVAAFLAAEAVANNLGGVPFLREADLVEAAFAAAKLYQFLARHFARGRVYSGEIVWAEARSLKHTDGTAWAALHPARRTAAETFAYVAHLAWQDERIALQAAQAAPTRLAAARDETMLETVDQVGDLTDEGKALMR